MLKRVMQVSRDAPLLVHRVMSFLKATELLRQLAVHELNDEGMDVSKNAQVGCV